MMGKDKVTSSRLNEPATIFLLISAAKTRSKEQEVGRSFVRKYPPKWAVEREAKVQDDAIAREDLQGPNKRIGADMEGDSGTERKGRALSCAHPFPPLSFSLHVDKAVTSQQQLRFSAQMVLKTKHQPSTSLSNAPPPMLPRRPVRRCHPSSWQQHNQIGATSLTLQFRGLL